MKNMRYWGKNVKSFTEVQQTRAGDWQNGLFEIKKENEKEEKGIVSE